MPNETRWTPGPWATLGKCDPDTEVIDAAEFSICTADDIAINARWQRVNPDKHWGSHHAAGSFVDRKPEELGANARLIAAAPDLYEALQELMPDGWDADDTMDHMPGVKKARLALAKARGEAWARRL